MLVLHAAFPIEDAKLDEALDLATTLVEESNKEDGMIDYRATQDLHDETTIRFFEQYEDADAFEAHMQTDHFQTFEDRLPDLLAGDPEIIQFEVSDATELDL